ncbi:STAS domain-containing protein [Streptomyces sp. NPDC059897]|uniref:STAS domain-containing protein n=1 Tax=Streptomyces sp. NPDC059897 TaxID=3346994 RepID=UPI00364CC548
MVPSNATWTSLLMSALARPTRTAPSAPVIEVFERGDRAAVAVHGEIDFDVAPAFDDALRAALERSIAGLDLELDTMTFCDGAGLRVLLRVRRAALETGKTVRLRSASPPLVRLLHVTRTHRLFADLIGLESACPRPTGEA